MGYIANNIDETNLDEESNDLSEQRAVEDGGDIPEHVVFTDKDEPRAGTEYEEAGDMGLPQVDAGKASAERIDDVPIDHISEGEHGDHARIFTAADEPAQINGKVVEARAEEVDPGYGYQDKLEKIALSESKIAEVQARLQARVLSDPSIPHKFKGREIQLVNAQAAEANAILATRKVAIGGAMYAQLDTRGRFKADAIQQKFGIDQHRAVEGAARDSYIEKTARTMLNNLQNDPEEYAKLEQTLYGSKIEDPLTGKVVGRGPDGLIHRDEMGLLTAANPELFQQMAAQQAADVKFGNTAAGRKLASGGGSTASDRAAAKDPLGLDPAIQTQASEIATYTAIAKRFEGKQDAEDDPRYIENQRNLNAGLDRLAKLKEAKDRSLTGGGIVDRESMAASYEAETEALKPDIESNKLARAAKTLTSGMGLVDASDSATRFYTDEAKKRKTTILDMSRPADFKKLIDTPVGTLTFVRDQDGNVSAVPWKGPEKWAQATVAKVEGSGSNVKEMKKNLDTTYARSDALREELRAKYPDISFRTNNLANPLPTRGHHDDSFPLSNETTDSEKKASEDIERYNAQVLAYLRFSRQLRDYNLARGYLQGKPTK